LLSHAPSQETSATVISVEDLWCGYAGRAVIQGISFCVKRGEFIGLLGPNGSGKTTLLLTISGVLPVEKGLVAIDGQPLAVLKHRERARHMAVVPQETEVRFPFECEEVVRMGRYPHLQRWQAESAKDREEVSRALRLTDTEKLAERLITAISGGEKQRVFVAKALAQEAPIMLLDEATSAMDISRKLQIFRVLEMLNHEEGLTIMAVMHDINLAALFCKRLLLLKDGRVVADGDTPSVMTAETLKVVYDTDVLVQEVSATGTKQVVFLP
jgi:iron complex transport system ATP-binding protein